jgi:hypothetical protein
MSWLFSQALAAEYSAASCSDGAPSAPSNTTPTPQAFLWRDKTTDAWSRFPSGLTCEPLTGDRGEGLLTWFREGFRAKTLAPLGRGGELNLSAADCGATWRELLAKFDRALRLWKTAHFLPLADLDEFSGTWPKWGIMLNGECWERTTPGHLTSATESGSSLPTPTASDHKRTPIKMEYGLRPQTQGCPDDLAKWAIRASGLQHGRLEPALWEWAMGWPDTWTELKPLATDKFQQWLRSHGVCSEGRAMSEEAA